MTSARKEKSSSERENNRGSNLIATGSEKISGDLWSFAYLKFISRTIFSLSCVVPSAGTEKAHLKGVERFGEPPRLATPG